MRILICIPCLLTGGTEIQTLSLVEALVAANHQVAVACYFEHAPAMVERYRTVGAEVFLLSANGSRSVGVRQSLSHLYHGLKRVVTEFKPEVAHVQYMAPGAIPILILRWLGVRRIVATAHTAADIYSPCGLKIIRFLNNHLLSAFQCITERAETSFFGSSSLFNESTSLRKHGNHFTIYNNLPSYISIRETPRERRADGVITVGVVSRLELIKGMDMVVPTFAEVHKDFPATRLLVVGDGSHREAMERQAAEAGVADATEFAGRQLQDALEGFYDRIDILLMPSRSEGFGLTAIEGMARGCVPVVADTGGLPEVVRDGVDGLLHRPGDVADLAAKIRQLISKRLSDHEHPVRRVDHSPNGLPAPERGSHLVTNNSDLIPNLSPTNSISRARAFSRDAYRARIQKLYQKLEMRGEEDIISQKLKIKN